MNFAATEKHAFLRIKDVPGISGPQYPVQIPSSLDMALTRLREKEAKVLNFWRTPIGWTIKVMVPRATQHTQKEGPRKP